MLLKAGLEFGVITARHSPMVKARMDELGVRHVYQAEENKMNAFEKIRETLQLNDQHIAFIGDDLIDLPCIRRAGLGVTVPNAVHFIRQHADWQTTKSGGTGAVRELIELILSSQNKLSSLYENYL